MPKNPPIGVPIPLGELPSLGTSAQPEPTITEQAAAAIEALRADILPSDLVDAITHELDTAVPTVVPDVTPQWMELMKTGWQLTLLPAMAWTSYVATSWKAWETSLQPQWPTR